MRRLIPVVVLLAACSKPQFEPLDAKFLAKPPAPKVPPGAFPAAASSRLTELAGHEGGKVYVAWSPDGKYLATAGYGDQGLALWDAVDFKQLGAARMDYRASGVAWLPDSTALLTTDVYGFVTYWTPGPAGPVDPVPVQTPFKDQGGIHGMALSPNGTLLAAVSWGSGVLLWDVAGRKPLRTFAAGKMFRAAAFSPDGGSLAVTGGSPPTFTVVDLAKRTATEWKVDKAEPTGEGSDLAYGSDGKFFCAGYNDTTFTIREAAGMKELHNHFLRNASVWAVRFSADGKVLATSQTGLGIYLWDPIGRAVLKFHEIKGTNAAALAFSPDGKTLAAGLEDGKVNIYR